MNATPTPTLVAKKTVSHPEEDAKVIGFEGRNSILGRDAIILKEEDIPGDGPFNGVPWPHSEAILDGDRDLYVLSERRVLGVMARRFADIAAEHTFSWDNGTYTCFAFHADDATVWSRDKVEVTVP